MDSASHSIESLRSLYRERSKIVENIRNIRVGPTKTFRQVEVSESTISSAKKFIKLAPNVYEIDGRYEYLRYSVLYSMDPGGSIYELLSRDAGDSTVLQADQKIQDWEDAIQHLLRYALNLLLAPRRPEFQSIKLYSSFYVYQVAKKLNEADKILMAMSYRVPSNRSSRDVDELKIEGEVDLDHVARTAADLVILKCDLKLLKGNAKSIGSDYPMARITDVLEARSMKEQTYRNTYDEAVARVRCRLKPNQQSSPNVRNCRQDAPYYASNSGNVGSRYFDVNREQARPHPGTYVTESQRSSNILPQSSAQKQNGNLLPRSAMEDQKSASRIIFHRDSAPLLDSTPTQDPATPESDSFISPDQSRRRLRRKSGSEGNLLDRGGSGSITSSRAPVPREGSRRAEAGDSIKRHTIGSGTESYTYTVGSPNDLEESFSIISFSDRARPNPEDLPEPVFQDEAAVMNNEYQRHLRHSSESSWPDSRVGIYVDSKSAYNEDTFRPLQPLLPNSHRHDYVGGGKLHIKEDPHQGAQPGYHEKTSYGQTSPAYSDEPLLLDSHRCGGLVDRHMKEDPHRGTQPGYHERMSYGRTSPPKSPYNGSDRTRSQNISSDSATSTTCHPHSRSNSSSKERSSFQSAGNPSVGSQPCSGEVQCQEKLPPPSATTIGPPKVMDRQDSSTSKCYESGIVDDFVNIDIVSEESSPSTRERSSHISEISRTEYEVKSKTEKSTSIENGDAKNSNSLLGGSNSQSDLDFNKEAHRTSSSWVCDYCTFINTDTDECEVCGIFRKSN